MTVSGLCSETEHVAELLTMTADQGEASGWEARQSVWKVTRQHNVTLFLSPHMVLKVSPIPGVEMENGLFISQLASHCLGSVYFDERALVRMRQKSEVTSRIPRDFLHTSCGISKRETPISQSVPVPSSPPISQHDNRGCLISAADPGLSWCHHVRAGGGEGEQPVSYRSPDVDWDGAQPEEEHCCGLSSSLCQRSDWQHVQPHV